MAAQRRAQMSEFQRARMLRAAVQVVAERGYNHMSVSAVCSRAGVSRKTFYEFFESRDDCYLAAFEHAVTEAAKVVVPAYQQGGCWPERVRGGLQTLLELLEANRDAGRLALCCLSGRGPLLAAERARVLGVLRLVVQEGQHEVDGASAATPLTGEVIVAGCLSAIDGRLRDRPETLKTLLNPLMAAIVLPYLGAAGAAVQLHRRQRRSATQAPPAESHNGLAPQELGLRVTFRTAAVLAAVAKRPGLSNVQVADAAGIRDQGQVSKLLARLGGLGLVENSGVGQSRGGANAWRLTHEGERVRSSLTRQFPSLR